MEMSISHSPFSFILQIHNYVQLLSSVLYILHSSANSVVSVISSLAGLLGPVAAGFLYGIYGIRMILLINTISFLLSAIMELFLMIPMLQAKITENVLKTFCDDITKTFSYLLHEKPLIFKTIIISCSLTLFLAPIYSVGMPYMVKIIFQMPDHLYGISEGLVGSGMIVGALLAGILGKQIPFSRIHHYFYGLILLIGVMGICPLPFIMAKSGISFSSYCLFTASAFAFSALLAIINILCMTYLQREIPMKFMGKAMALFIAISNSLYPIGQIIFGGLYNAFAKTTWVVYIIIGLCTIIVTLIMRSIIKKAFPVTA